jgi:hypothetical protein
VERNPKDYEWFRLYNTKHALTKGVVEIAAKRLEGTSCYILRVKKNQTLVYISEKNRNWHLTREAALQRAEEMRRTALGRLDSQREKIIGLVFK